MKNLLLIFLLIFSNVLFSQQIIEVQYVANEGVLIKSGDKKVLIDGLFKSTYPNYESTPDSAIEKINQGKKPYDDLDILLVSHVHSDHFSTDMILDALKSNKKLKCYVNQQVGDSLKTRSTYSKLSKQIKIFENKEVNKYEYNGIVVETAKVFHASESSFGWVENSSHMIQMNGFKIVHAGDPAYGNTDISNFKFSDKDIDIAILPYWLLNEEKTINKSKEIFNADHFIANHIPRNTMDQMKLLAKNYLELDVIDFKENFRLIVN